ncbi:GIY-YIG nuclease family protein [Roseibium limicola]|uniref:GIY-YIG nuclease family protein n=1 Tax=Roseibium limicola TaxID=2816037 RepID=A0A939J8E9_9HYPH|nr:GIY-YIG nuclease family protein [Roseibium limicola]MBO0347122.1 GIY-YIG nuclease family protein [Roseibium limicola]
MTYFVYILASGRNGTLYTGVTNDLARRVYEHKTQVMQGFTSKYACKSLVWYEAHETIVSAIQREKSVKRYYRKWKLNLIEELNPEWNDLYDQLNQ